MCCIQGPIISPLSVHAASDNRNTLAKELYARVCEWSASEQGRN